MSSPPSLLPRVLPPHTLRLMLSSDIPACLAIQSACYPAPLNEPASKYLARLQLYPRGCMVALDAGGSIVGYVQSHPWHSDAGVPCVDTEAPALPPSPSSFFIFDSAVLPAGRGCGVGAALADACEREAASIDGVQELRLVAVLGAEAFWRRRGFLEEGLVTEGYGGVRAVHMRRKVGGGGGGGRGWGWKGEADAPSH